MMAKPTQEQLLDFALMLGAHVRHVAALCINPFEVSAGLRQSVHVQNWWRESPGVTHCGRYGARALPIIPESSWEGRELWKGVLGSLPALEDPAASQLGILWRSSAVAKQLGCLVGGTRQLGRFRSLAGNLSLDCLGGWLASEPCTGNHPCQQPRQARPLHVCPTSSFGIDKILPVTPVSFSARSQ